MNDQGTHEDAAPSSAAARHISPPISAASGHAGARRPPHAPQRHITRWHAAALAWAGVAGLLACAVLGFAPATQAAKGLAGIAQSDPAASGTTPPAILTANASATDAAGTATSAAETVTASAQQTATASAQATATYTAAVKTASIAFAWPVSGADSSGPVLTHVTVLANGFTSELMPKGAQLAWYIVPASNEDAQTECSVAQSDKGVPLKGSQVQVDTRSGTYTYTFPWPSAAPNGRTPYDVCVTVIPSGGALADTASLQWWKTGGSFHVLSKDQPSLQKVSISTGQGPARTSINVPLSSGASSTTTLSLPATFDVTISGKSFLPAQPLTVLVTLGGQTVTADSSSTEPLGEFTSVVTFANTTGKSLSGNLSIEVTTAQPSVPNAPAALQVSTPPLIQINAAATSPAGFVPSSILAIALDLLALALAGGGVFALWLGFAGSGGGNGGGGTSGGYRQPVASAARQAYAPPRAPAYGPPQAPGYGQPVVMPAPMPSGPLRMPPGQMPPSQMPGRPSPPPGSLPPDSPLYGHGPPADQQHPGDPGNGSAGP